MARKVNTRFVILLASVLGAMVLGAGGWALWKYNDNRNPVSLEAKGDREQARGNFNAAMNYYARAASQSGGVPGEDRRWEKYANLCFEQSAGRSDLYVAALAGWDRVLKANPGHRAVAAKRLPELYRLVRVVTRRPFNYGTPLPRQLRVRDLVEQLTRAAGEVLALDPQDPQAYLARGYSGMLQLPPAEYLSDRKDSAAARVRGDIEQAAKLRPDDAEVVLVRAEFDVNQARAFFSAKRDADARKGVETAAGRLQTFAQAHGDEPGVTAEWAVLRLNAAPAQLEAVIAHLVKVHQKYPAHLRLSEVLAGAYDRAQRLADAANVFRQATLIAPTDGRAYLRLAEYCQAVEKYEGAAKAWESVYELGKPQPGTPAAKVSGMQALLNEYLRNIALLELPTAYMALAAQQGALTPAGEASLSKARLYIDAIRGASPNSAYVLLLDGRVLYLQQQFPSALEQLKRADAVLSSEAEMMASPRNFRIVKYYLAEAHLALRDYSPALACYDAILRQDPDNYDALLARGRLCLTMNLPERTLRDMETLRRRQPDSTRAIHLQALACEKLGRRDEALKLFSQLSPEQSDLASASLILNDNPEAAATRAEAVLEKDPEHEQANYLMALVHMRLKRPEKAIAIMKRLVARFPENLRYQVALRTMESPDAKAEDLQRAVIESIKDPFDQQMAWASYYRGQRNVEKELAVLREAEKIRPDNASVVDAIFVVLLRMKEYEQAARYVGKATAGNIDGVGGLSYRGRLEIARGEKEKGIQTLQTAVARWPEHAQAHVVLGQAYLDVGLTDLAIDEFAKALEIHPGNLVALRSVIPLCLSKGDRANTERATSYLKQALGFHRQDPVLTRYEDLLGDVDAALRRRLEAYQKDPTNVQSIQMLAQVHLRKARALAATSSGKASAAAEFDKAIALIKPLLEKEPGDLRLVDLLSRIYREAGRSNDALGVIQPLLVSDKEEVRDTAKLYMARMYRTLAQRPEAVQLYQEIAAKPAQTVQEAARELADLYFELEDLANAERWYKKIYTEEPVHDLRMLRRLIECQVRQNKFSEADAKLTEALRQRPDNAEVLVLSGYSLLRQGQSSQASEIFHRVLEKNPQHIDALYFRAISHFTLLGNLEQAAGDLQSLKKIKPDKLEGRLLLARVYRLLRKPVETTNEYRQALQVAPDDVRLRLELAGYLLELTNAYRTIPENSREQADIDVRFIKPADVLAELLSDSSARFPKQPVWRQRLAELLTLVGRPGDAQAVLRKAARELPEDGSIATAYLLALVQAKAYAEALAEADAVAVRMPYLPVIHITRAACLLAQDKEPDAMREADRALDSCNNYEFIASVARDLAQTVERSRLIARWETQLAQRPGDLRRRLALSMLLTLAGEPAKVAAVLEPALAHPEVAQDSGRSLRVLITRALAGSAYLSRNYEGSVKYHDQVLALLPEDLGSLNDSAYIMAEYLRRPADALQRAEKAMTVLKQTPVDRVYNTHGNVMDTYGWILFQNDRVPDALAVLQRGLKTDPSPLMWYHLARAWERQKQPADAKRAVAEALRLGERRGDTRALELAKDLQKRLYATK